MSTPKVLVVEDEALVAYALAATLEDSGYEVVGPAASGRQALEVAEATEPDVALVDMNLADGRTGAAVARALEGRFGTVSIAMTANPEGLEEGAGGIARILHKPYLEEAVLDLVEWAALHQAHRQITGAMAAPHNGGQALSR